MGKRRNTSPSKDLPKPKQSSAVKVRASFAKPSSSSTDKDFFTKVAVVSEVIKGVDFNVKVFIDSECRRLAEEAASGKQVHRNPLDSRSPDRTSQVLPQSSRPKLKRLSIQLERLELKREAKDCEQYTSISGGTGKTAGASLGNQNLRNTWSQLKQEDDRSSLRTKTRVREPSPHYDVEKMESSSSNPATEEPNQQQQVKIESCESETGKGNDQPLSDSSSDDVQIPVLEKPVSSDKEDSVSDGDASTNPADDSDYESSLLSPSALPASALVPKKKQRRTTEVGEKKTKSICDSPLSSKRFSPPLSSSTPGPGSELALQPSFQGSMTLLASPCSSSPYFSFEMPLRKKGRGRPLKPLEEVKSYTGKLYRKKMEIRNRLSQEFQLHSSVPSLSPLHAMSSFPGDQATAVTPLHRLPPATSSLSATAHPPQKRVPPASPTSDPVNFRKRLQRWQDRSTFMYARHKFAQNAEENKFRCATCNVSFTALSSLKRHYGTIYHKQQLGEVNVPSSVLALPAPPSSTISLPLPSASHHLSAVGPSSTTKRSRRGSSTVPFRRSQSAAASIKKYYAAADAARRNKAVGVNLGGTTNSYASSAYGIVPSYSFQKRKRKALKHSGFLYPSSSADSDAEEDERFGRRSQFDPYAYENIENKSPVRDADEFYFGKKDQFLENNAGEDKPKGWLSNVWKGIGPPHFTCEVCGESFSKKLEFTQHLFVHREEEAKELALTCPDCKTQFSTEAVLQHHYRLLNHGPAVPPPWDSGIPKRFRCAICGSAFSRREYYKKHLDSHSRPPLQCCCCSNINGTDESVEGGGAPAMGGVNAPAVAGDAGGLVVSGGAPAPKSVVKVELFSETTTFINEEPMENEKGKRKSLATPSEEWAKKRMITQEKAGSGQEATRKIARVQSSKQGLIKAELVLPMLAGPEPATESIEVKRAATLEDSPKEISKVKLEVEWPDIMVSSRGEEEGEVCEGQEEVDNCMMVDDIDEQGLGADITWPVEENEMECVQQFPESQTEQRQNGEDGSSQLTGEKGEDKEADPKTEKAGDVNEKGASATPTMEPEVEKEVMEIKIENAPQRIAAGEEKDAEGTSQKNVTGNEVPQELNSNLEEKAGSSSSNSNAGTSSTKSKEGRPRTNSSEKKGLSVNDTSGKACTTMLDESGREVFKCLECFRVYPTKRKLNLHRSYHNKLNAARALRESEAIDTKFHCDLCPGNKCFTWRKDLLRHKRVKHGVGTKRRSSLDETRTSTSKEIQAQPSPKRCSHCPLVFPVEADLRQHVAQEHDEVGIKETTRTKVVEEAELKFEEKEDVEEDDDDVPPTPSPHTSPIPILSRNDEDFDEEDDDDDVDGDPGSPEFELPELI